MFLPSSVRTPFFSLTTSPSYLTARTRPVCFFFFFPLFRRIQLSPSQPGTFRPPRSPFPPPHPARYAPPPPPNPPPPASVYLNARSHLVHPGRTGRTLPTKAFLAPPVMTSATARTSFFFFSCSPSFFFFFFFFFFLDPIFYCVVVAFQRPSE